MIVFRTLRRLENRSSAILLTYGVVFAQLKIPHPQRQVDYIWSIIMLLSAIFASIVFSGSIYAILVNVKYEPEIDTFEQLIATDLLIYSSADFNENYYKFQK